MSDKYYTEKQLLLESWINELGYRTNLEVAMEPYQVDILLIECDGI